MRCIVCSLRFRTPGRLTTHAVLAHGANRVTIERAIAQSLGGAVALVATQRGRVMVLIQPPLM